MVCSREVLAADMWLLFPTADIRNQLREHGSHEAFLCDLTCLMHQMLMLHSKTTW